MLSRTETIAVVVALVVVGGAFVASNYFSPGLMTSNESGSAALSESLLGNLGVVEAPQGEAVTTSEGLVIQDIVVGTGAEAVAGKMITAHYTGVLEDGTVFDSSIPRGVPFEFTLGEGAVIKGWDQGIVGMKVGGKRILVIPPELGYGASGIGPIPPNATLVFQVELVDVK